MNRSFSINDTDDIPALRKKGQGFLLFLAIVANRNRVELELKTLCFFVDLRREVLQTVDL